MIGEVAGQHHGESGVVGKNEAALSAFFAEEAVFADAGPALERGSEGVPERQAKK